MDFEGIYKLLRPFHVCNTGSAGNTSLYSQFYMAICLKLCSTTMQQLANPLHSHTVLLKWLSLATSSSNTNLFW